MRWHIHISRHTYVIFSSLLHISQYSLTNDLHVSLPTNRTTPRSLPRCNATIELVVSVIIPLSYGFFRNRTRSGFIVLAYACTALILQHDPDDEPCAPPLDPEFFEFDCALCSNSAPFSHSDYIPKPYSAQGRHQSRATQGIAVRRDHVFPPDGAVMGFMPIA